VDSFFFLLSKVIWPFMAPDFLLVIIFFAGTLLLLSGRTILAKYILSGVAVAIIAIVVFPLGHWLFAPLELRFEIPAPLPEKVDGILILSGGINSKATAVINQVQINEQADRDFAFMRLAQQYPNARLVYSGGSSSLVHQQYKGADAALRFLSEMGLDTSRVVFERDSRNTYESAVMSKQLIKPEKGETWLLVTSAFHIPRSVGAFCQVGWPMIPYPVDFKSDGRSGFSFPPDIAGNLQKFTLAFKEWTGLFAYWSTSKISDFLPGDCQ
jgi:uncharacterized SAM-binding protein YcdF (DUF218 family)